MQVATDWRATMGPLEFASTFSFQFQGPGWYLTKSDSLLVVPMPPNEAATAENMWHQRQPEGTLYDVHVFNCNFRETIFSVKSGPVREDQRE